MTRLYTDLAGGGNTFPHFRSVAKRIRHEISNLVFAGSIPVTSIFKLDSVSSMDRAPGYEPGLVKCGFESHAEY